MCHPHFIFDHLFAYIIYLLNFSIQSDAHIYNTKTQIVFVWFWTFIKSSREKEIERAE